MKNADERALAVDDAIGRIHNALYALPHVDMGGLDKSAVRNVLTNLGPAIRAELMALAEQARAATETGYTRAQFEAAVDEAHAALHGLDETMATSGLTDAERRGRLGALLVNAHEALHRVGAGMPRVGCATHDPEAQRIAADLRKLGEQALPCGHKVEDLIGGTDPDGRPSVTKCGACLAARQPEIVAANRLKYGAKFRADEIEAAALEEDPLFGFLDAIRFARIARDDTRRATVEMKTQRRLDAVAWLIVAQRMLEREGSR